MQIQFQYNLYEDRLSLVLAEGEASPRAWLITRRAAKMLAQALVARVRDSLDPTVTETAKDWLLALREEAAVEQNPITNDPPVAAETSHLLVAIRHGRGEDGRHVLVFVAQDGEEEGVAFDDDSLLAVLALFKRQLAKTDWDLSLSWPEAAALGTDCLGGVQ